MTDLAGTGTTAADQPAVEIAPVAPPATPREWLRRNLFSSWGNGLLTAVTAAILLYLAFRLLRFVFVTADWSVLRANLRVYMVGRFPVDELWRVWASLYLVTALAGVSRGMLPRVRWTRVRAALTALPAVLLLGALLYLLESARVWSLLGVEAAVFAGGVVVGRRLGRRLRAPLVVGWILAFPTVILLLRAFGGVKPELWGGFLLNVIVAVVAIFASFPLGLLLALGRRSRLPAVSAFSVAFIEVVRGVPLVAWLIFGQYVLPLLLPPALDLPNIVRAMFMFTIFSAAYVAEIVRGGLQGVPQGQYEAARALGLHPTRMMALVILPQALRSTIPAMISHLISLFKDTSLLAALGLFSDLLRNARRASAAIEYIGLQAEALLPAALIFWVVAFSMSRWSQRVERRVGVGER
ncbi:MAG: amino acid ABC transporter permease [Actinomycetota bacterium]